MLVRVFCFLALVGCGGRSGIDVDLPVPDAPTLSPPDASLPDAALRTPELDASVPDADGPPPDASPPDAPSPDAPPPDADPPCDACGCRPEARIDLGPCDALPALDVPQVLPVDDGLLVLEASYSGVELHHVAGDGAITRARLIDGPVYRAHMFASDAGLLTAATRSFFDSESIFLHDAAGAITSHTVLPALAQPGAWGPTWVSARHDGTRWVLAYQAGFPIDGGSQGLLGVYLDTALSGPEGALELEPPGTSRDVSQGPDLALLGETAFVAYAMRDGATEDLILARVTGDAVERTVLSRLDAGARHWIAQVDATSSVVAITWMRTMTGELLVSFADRTTTSDPIALASSAAGIASTWVGDRLIVAYHDGAHGWLAAIDPATGDITRRAIDVPTYFAQGAWSLAYDGCQLALVTRQEVSFGVQHLMLDRFAVP